MAVLQQPGEPPVIKVPYRFVMADISINRRVPTRIVCYERNGWKLKAIETKRIEADNAMEIAHAIANMCGKHQCIPLIEDDWAGRPVLGMVTEHLGGTHRWPPSLPELIQHKSGIGKRTKTS